MIRQGWKLWMTKWANWWSGWCLSSFGAVRFWWGSGSWQMVACWPAGEAKGQVSGATAMHLVDEWEVAPHRLQVSEGLALVELLVEADSSLREKKNDMAGVENGATKPWGQDGGNVVVQLGPAIGESRADGDVIKTEGKGELNCCEFPGMWRWGCLSWAVPEGLDNSVGVRRPGPTWQWRYEHWRSW